MPLARAYSTFRRDARGAAAVEFAIIANVFIAFVMGIIYVSIMLFNYASLGWAVNDAARLAAINPLVTQTDIAAAINARLSSFGISQATVTYTTSVLNSIQTGHIAASFQQAYTIPFVSTFHITFSSDAYVPMGV